jgi:extracellular elastinolytic metalloproteinase
MGQRSTRAAVAAVAAVATATAITGPPRAMAQPPDAHGDMASSPADRAPDRERMGNFDASSATFKVLANQAVDAASKNPAAVQRLSSQLGPQAVFDIDPTTGTPRNVGRLDGYLTGPSTRSAADVARSYVGDHLAAFGLTQADMSTLRLTRTYVDTIGVRHVYWTQVRDGIPVFGHGLRANVTERGELLSVQGSPLPGLTAAKASSTPRLSASEARATAVRDVGGRVQPGSQTRSSVAGAPATAWSNGDSARQVWYDTPAGLRLGWWTVSDGGDTKNYSHVIDADTGAVLYRRDLVQFDRGDAQVFDNYPGAPRGGQQRTVNLVDQGWIEPSAPCCAAPSSVHGRT